MKTTILNHNNETKFRCVLSDAAEFLSSQENDSIDLLFTSPPYEAARTYGIGFNLRGQAWVDWMVNIVRIASPKVKGLIAINCEGQTRDFSYSGTPYLLLADLIRTGFTVRKPPIFRRVGIPGSGGPDWLRNDYEPIICVTRGGKLPFANNTACGSPPKYLAGGEMSNRDEDGRRINARHRRTTSQTRRKSNGERLNDGDYVKPEIANPGNAIQEKYTAEQVAKIIAAYESGDLIDCNVGGGQMGHKAAHRNEAPFPLTLAEFFVKSFCPPGGIVCDPFSGSGTTAHAAKENGRRFVGCDVRQSQVDLTLRRLDSITPPMFYPLTERATDAG